MNLRDGFEKVTKEKIALLQKHCDEWSDSLNIDFPDEWHFKVIGLLSAYSNFIRIGCPFNRILYAKVENLMLENGYTLNKLMTKLDESTDWYPYMTFTKKGAPSLEFVFFDFEEGSVCKKRQIGEIVTKTPVYEFACTNIDE